MLCARQHLHPHVKMEGYRPEDKLVAFTSCHAHYTIKRGAFMMGLGMNNVVYVAVDKDGHMCPSALEDAIKKCIQEGKKPFYVNATAGTTVLGVYDPIDACADVCQKYNMWLHVDGALGASALMSPTHKHLMKGVNRADSVTWCLHKMLGMNQQCSAFISRHNNILKKTNS